MTDQRQLKKGNMKGMHIPPSLEELNRRSLPLCSRLGYISQLKNDSQTGKNAKLPLLDKVIGNDRLTSYLMHKQQEVVRTLS